MGEIVAAIATCHAPQLFTRPPDEDHAQLDATIAAMRELGKILDETRPDALIFLGSDHLETFSMTCVPTFAVVAGSRAIAEFAGRSYSLPVHRAMAEDLLNKLIRADFDVAYSEDAVLGHTFAVPFEFVLGGRDIPVVPFHTNVYMPPLPSPKRCGALGRELARIIASRPERVAVLASGGMSHYPGTWKYPMPEFEFDRWVISELERGRSNAVLDLTVEQLDEAGNTELLNWAIMLGAIGEQPGELLQYTPTWHHGHAMMRFLPAKDKAETTVSAAGLPPYGGLKFKDEGFQFYKHPPASAYNLNKLLFDVRHDSGLRRRLLTDLDGVAADYGLDSKGKEGARALAEVADTPKISDNAGRIVNAGAHPLQALMTLHAVHGELKKLRSELSPAAKNQERGNRL
jgi:aromatic ring-opening dioxygenase catalytic subunit (LigB family)